MPHAVPARLSVASLWAAAVVATVRFYGDLLGLRLCLCQGRHMDSPHFDMDGAFLAILEGKLVLAQDARPFPLIALAVNDLDFAVHRLKIHHVDLVKAVAEDLASRWVFFCDLGGNLIELAYWK